MTMSTTVAGRAGAPGVDVEVRHPDAAPKQAPVDFRLAEWLVQPTLGRLTRDDSVLRIRPQLMDMLVCLSARPGRTLTKDELLATVWADRFVAESGLARCVAELRQVLGDDARQPRIIETIPKRGYRVIATVDLLPQQAPPGLAHAATEPARESSAGLEPAGDPGSGVGRTPARDPGDAIGASTAVVPAQSAARRGWSYVRGAFLGLAALGVFGSTGAGLSLLGQDPSAVPAKPSQVLVAFSNVTGEAAFDRVLPLALAVQVEQDPALHVMSTEQVDALMVSGERVAGLESARTDAEEACRRTGAAASLTGSLSPRGRHFELGLEAVACATGESLIRQVVSVDSRDMILPEMRRMAVVARDRLSAALASRAAGQPRLAIVEGVAGPPAGGPPAKGPAYPREHE